MACYSLLKVPKALHHQIFFFNSGDSSYIGDDLQQQITQLRGLVQMQAEKLVNQTNLIEELTQRINSLTGVDNGDSTDIQTLNQRLNNHTIEIEELSQRIDTTSTQISQHTHDSTDIHLRIDTLNSSVNTEIQTVNQRIDDTNNDVNIVDETLSDVKTDVDQQMDRNVVLETKHKHSQ